MEWCSGFQQFRGVGYQPGGGSTLAHAWLPVLAEVQCRDRERRASQSHPLPGHGRASGGDGRLGSLQHQLRRTYHLQSLNPKVKSSRPAQPLTSSILANVLTLSTREPAPPVIRAIVRLFATAKRAGQVHDHAVSRRIPLETANPPPILTKQVLCPERKLKQ